MIAFLEALYAAKHPKKSRKGRRSGGHPSSWFADDLVDDGIV
jgi:hypothetical protein